MNMNNYLLNNIRSAELTNPALSDSTITIESSFDCIDLNTLNVYAPQSSCLGVSPLENKSSVVFNSLDMIKVGDVGLEDAIMKKLMEKLSLFPTVQHKCHNCGAIVEIDENKHVFVCKYCGSVYAIGTKMKNDLGD